MKSWLRYLKDWIYLVLGAAAFKLTGRNHEFSYHALIRLYCRTQGRSTSLIFNIVRRLHPAKLKVPAHGVLGTFNAEQLSVVTEKLNKDGFFVFEKTLPDQILNEILKFTEKTKAVLRRHDADPITQKAQKIIYTPGSPQAVRYDYSSEDLIKNPAVQKLLADPSILAVARAYLGVEPMIDIVTMWWHTDFHKQPDSNAAQFFHFDMDRIRWLKFFFYITDVTPETGPHCFVRGTHRAENIPRSILDKGYVRIMDEEMKQHYRPEDFIEFSGVRGTVIAEDTAGFHKGKPVHSGHRLVFQLEFAVSMFGSPGFEKLRISDVRIPELNQMIAQNPRIYKNFESSLNG